MSRGKVSTGFTGHGRNFHIDFGSAALRSNFYLTVGLATKFLLALASTTNIGLVCRFSKYSLRMNPTENTGSLSSVSDVVSLVPLQHSVNCCREDDVFNEPLPRNGSLCWLNYSGFQETSYSINTGSAECQASSANYNLGNNSAFAL
jgi:hypothetical protein